MNFIYLRPLLDDFLLVQSAGHRQTLSVVGDRNVFQAKRDSGAGHFLNGIFPVGPVGLNLKISLERAVFYKFRQFTGFRRFNFTGISPKLRRHPHKSQLFVNFLFVPAGNHSVPSAGGEKPVLIEFIPFFNRDFSQSDVMLLAAGEILNRRAV